MESLQEIEKAQQKEDDVPEVSYTVLVTNHKDPSDILQQVADSINLQLTLDGQYLPLIAPNSFDNAKHHDKLFLYGPSGCGKSRNIFELIKQSDTEFLYTLKACYELGLSRNPSTVEQLQKQFLAAFLLRSRLEN